MAGVSITHRKAPCSFLQAFMSINSKITVNIFNCKVALITGTQIRATKVPATNNSITIKQQQNENNNNYTVSVTKNSNGQ